MRSVLLFITPAAFASEIRNSSTLLVEVIDVFIVICNCIARCCKCSCRGVRFPNVRALHVLSNTFAFYPVVIFFGLKLQSLQFRLQVASRWLGRMVGWMQ